MREILFRGKRESNGGWVYGYFFAKPILEKYFIELGNEMWQVKPSTIGQYTGMTDKSGAKIFEGDIVSAKNNICGETYRFLVEFGVCGGVENSEHSVGFPCFFFKDVTGIISNDYMLRKDPVYFLNAYKCEVIGNVHDNPDLLKLQTF